MVKGALMLQGSGSNAGKSLLTALLLRILKRRGLKVAPFKPQNMSNNAFVTKEGREIGRAQALQALAAKVEPHHDMNPILLKPESDGHAQLIVRGQAQRRVTARQYYALKKELLQEALAAFRHLQASHDVILIEGAGSPAEINLRAHDIANMGFALAAASPVLLISDLERGGAFAALVGCWKLFSHEERQLLRGYLLNQMRGDESLLNDGITQLRHYMPVPCWGVVPHFPQARTLPAEDSLSLARQQDKKNAIIKIAILKLPHIANSDDFDPLIHDDAVDCIFVEDGARVPAVDAIILPGSKAVMADTQHLFACGWAYDVLAAARRGKVIFGLCGGFQMLGQFIDDALAIEGKKDKVTALKLLNCHTVLHKEKVLQQRKIPQGEKTVQGYEIHHGITQGADCARPLLKGVVSAQSADGRVSGCYLHGYFHNDSLRKEFLARINPHYEEAVPPQTLATHQTLDHLAKQLERHIDMAALLSLFQEKSRSQKGRLSS